MEKRMVEQNSMYEIRMAESMCLARATTNRN